MHTHHFSLPQSIPSFLRKPLEDSLGLSELNTVYNEVREQGAYNDAVYAESFTQAVLNTLNIRLRTDRHEIIRIPRTGPCIVSSNHPHGALDGIALLNVLLSIRSDVKVIANEVLMSIEELRPHLLCVDVFTSGRSSSVNSAALLAAFRWLKKGGMLLAFPAGEVSSFKLSSVRVSDRKWSEHIGRIAQQTNACVVPAYIHGTNSLWFHVLGFVHSRLRTVRLVREFLKQRDTTLRITFGNVLPSSEYHLHPCHSSVSEYLQFRSSILRYKQSEKLVQEEMRIASGSSIAAPSRVEVMLMELQQLRPQQILLKHNEFIVLQAQSAEIPEIMREVGRLRELTFRLIGEGTGRALDIDRFDSLYEHIILWNTERQEVVGAYRLGRVDELHRRFGMRGLYLHTLFNISEKFLSKTSPALELGRSFVRPEYQKNFAPLLLLWKGIGTFLCRHPHYTYLIGPVSISNEFSISSQRLILNSLIFHHSNRELQSYVKPRTRIDKNYFANWDRLLTISSLLPLQRLDSVIRDLEQDAKSLPILLKQYLRLGAQVVGFTRDSSFAHCVDGLMMVDLRKTPRPQLEKYMGQAGAQLFLEYQAELRSSIPSTLATPGHTEEKLDSSILGV